MVHRCSRCAGKDVRGYVELWVVVQEEGEVGLGVFERGWGYKSMHCPSLYGWPKVFPPRLGNLPLIQH